MMVPVQAITRLLMVRWFTLLQCFYFFMCLGIKSTKSCFEFDFPPVSSHLH